MAKRKVDRRQGMSLSADDHLNLTKPSTEEELLEVVSVRLKKMLFYSHYA